MAVMQRVRKATTRKGKKALVAKEPKAIEGPKQSIFMQGRSPSERTRAVMKDLYGLRKPDAVYLTRKNDIVPFEDATLIERLCYKKEASLFSVGSHSKKRPHNLILGRTFDYKVLDMVELGADAFKGLAEFSNSKVCPGIKPCLVFNGPGWELSEDLKRLKSLFTDFFHREKVETIRLQGLEHVLGFTAAPDSRVLLRSYKIHLKKSGQRTPRIELEEIGPSIDFTLRRTKLASPELFKDSCRTPKELKSTVKKNISRDAFGSKLGRIHMGRQDIGKLQTRKMKGLRKTPEERREHRLRNKGKGKGITKEKGNKKFRKANKS